MRASRTMLVVALAIARTMVPAHAQNSIDWSALDARTRELLAPWSDNWQTQDAASRAQLLANAKRWQAMDATARIGFLRRISEWQALPPLERARQRARYAAWRALPINEQQQVRTAAARLSALPAEQQATLRAQFAALDADRQRAWLLGPSTGGWIEQARQLFGFVPASERDATLEMLRGLPIGAREQLFVLARNLPDDRRDLLRRQLLGADPAHRVALLGQRGSQ